MAGRQNRPRALVDDGKGERCSRRRGGLRAADRASLWASKRGKGDGRMSQRHSVRLGSGSAAGVARGTPAKEAPPSSRARDVGGLSRGRDQPVGHVAPHVVDVCDVGRGQEQGGVRHSRRTTDVANGGTAPANLKRKGPEGPSGRQASTEHGGRWFSWARRGTESSALEWRADASTPISTAQPAKQEKGALSGGSSDAVDWRRGSARAAPRRAIPVSDGDGRPTRRRTAPVSLPPS